MSRFAIAFTLFASLSTNAVADERWPAPSSKAHGPSMKFASAPVAPAADMPISSSVRLDRAAIRAKLAKNRAANLARFRVYQKKGTFPNNTYTDGKLNVWQDQFGNLCAAATIMKLSGQHDLVASVADQNNFIKLGDVTSGPLLDWILTSGLTQAEIAAIQEPMMGVNDEPMMEPVQPIIVNKQMRRLEDKRLVATYKLVEQQIIKNRNKSLDAATDRLLANPDLAASFLNG